jgi:hypothetical protein
VARATRHPLQSLVFDDDVVLLDGAPIGPAAATVCAVLNKAKGVTCTARDPKGRADLSPYLRVMPPGCFAVGRLDRDTTGLLLFTNFPARGAPAGPRGARHQVRAKSVEVTEAFELRELLPDLERLATEEKAVLEALTDYQCCAMATRCRPITSGCDSGCQVPSSARPFTAQRRPVRLLRSSPRNEESDSEVVPSAGSRVAFDPAQRGRDLAQSTPSKRRFVAPTQTT